MEGWDSLEEKIKEEFTRKIKISENYNDKLISKIDRLYSKKNKVNKRVNLKVGFNNLMIRNSLGMSLTLSGILIGIYNISYVQEKVFNLYFTVKSFSVFFISNL